MRRRQFLKAGATAGLASMLGCRLWENLLDSMARDDLAVPMRVLGRTGERLSVIGFGGMSIVGEEQAVADRMVAETFDRGVNYYDVAPI